MATLEHRDHDQVLIQFGDLGCPVLVTTDWFERGLDIVGLEAVIKVRVKRDAKQQMHRTGRTCRTEAERCAFSLDEMGQVGRIGQVQGRAFEWFPLSEQQHTGIGPLHAPMATLQILGGRKEKIRRGDRLGALAGDGGLPAVWIGKINGNEISSFADVDRTIAAKGLKDDKGKGKKVKAQVLEVRGSRTPRCLRATVPRRATRTSREALLPVPTAAPPLPLAIPDRAVLANDDWCGTRQPAPLNEGAFKPSARYTSDFRGSRHAPPMGDFALWMVRFQLSEPSDSTC